MPQQKKLKTASGKVPKSKKGDLVLKLYITGASPNSARAINNIREICEEYLTDNYSLEIIDVYRQPEMVKDEQIIALPLLVKQSPLPERKLVGDMSQKDKVLKGFGLK